MTKHSDTYGISCTAPDTSAGGNLQKDPLPLQLCIFMHPHDATGIWQVMPCIVGTCPRSHPFQTTGPHHLQHAVPTLASCFDDLLACGLFPAYERLAVALTGWRMRFIMQQAPGITRTE